MKPWEKRLRDLSRLLENCHTTYLDPDLFCMNTNQFLQTSRTVTFIIQKEKNSIPDFDSWYTANVLNPWKHDEVMTWAKEARNRIEKEGDLDLNSTLKLTLVFSYLEEEDYVIQCGKSELLHARVKQLVRLAQKKLPTGISDAASVMIERRWVTSSLSHWELLHAMSYVYARVFECCTALAKHLEISLDKSIPDAGQLSTAIWNTRQVQYVKLNGLSSHYIASKVITQKPDFTLPRDFQEKFNLLNEEQLKPSSIKTTSDYYTKMAELTFKQYGYHIPMLFLLDKSWLPIDMVSTKFDDQADKYIFWRSIADRVITLKATAVVWISETWLRQMDKSGNTPIRNMHIIGERLHIAVADNTGARINTYWNIERQSKSSAPILKQGSPDDSENEGHSFYLVPVLRAMGLKEIQS